MKFYDNFVELISRRRKSFIVIFVLINILSLVGIFRIRINTDFTLFMPEHSKAMNAYEEMIADFGSSEQLVFLIRSSAADTTGMLREFFEIQGALNDIEGVKFVSGPVPPMIPSGFGTKPIEEIDDSNAQTIMNYIDELGSLKALYREADGDYGLFIVSPVPEKNEEVAQKVLDYVSGSGLDYYNSGDYYLQSSILTYILQIIFIIPPFALFFLLIIFRWKLGNMKSTFLSILPAGIGALWTMGLLGWTSLELSVITVLTPVFTIVMGSADGLHFISHIQDEMKKGATIKQALVGTLLRVGWAMILTTLTTVAGFMSLLVIQSAPMRQLAMTASIGIALAGLATWVFLPVICVGMKNIGKVKEKTNPVFDPISPILRGSMGRRSVIITVLICLLFIPGILMIKTDLNMINIYKGRTQIRQNIDTISRISGGAIPLFIEIKCDEDPIMPDTASVVLELEKTLRDEGVVSRTLSIYDIFSTLNTLVFGADEGTYPDNEVRIGLIYNLFSVNQPQQVQSTLLRDKKMARIVVFPKNLSHETLETIERVTNDFSNQHTAFKALGMPFIMKEMNDRIMPDQVGSIFLAVLLVFVLMVFTLRSVKMAFIGVVPLGATLIALFGFMGYASIDLSIITSTMASITIGVGIDYSIHLTTLFKHFLKDHDSKEAAMLSFEYVEKPVIANAVGLALGLSSLLFSPMQFHTYMSMLMWVTMLVSSYVSLTFLPTLLERFFRDGK
ncbi:MAG TPA: MMPL family transporter [Thermotogota bacterium]|nr:MMPL family transporter [Thermotogota bacterium]HPJ87793.1 MMPL family transporter [Thermotogota bacterium]HPR95209.1 MMPL family transporter [Thermotogota bacterium]